MDKILKSKYKILDKISETYSNVVYRGIHVDSNIPLLIRIYKRDYLNSNLIKQLKKEVSSLSKLINPMIPRLLDGDYGWQGFYFIREFASGTNIDEIKKPVPIEKAHSIAKGVLDALSFAHSLGIVHGHLSSHNIFIENESDIKVADFCIKTLLSRTFDKKAATILKDNMDFTSPEEILGKKPSIQSDIYNFGLLLYLMLSGHLPFNGKNSVDLAINQIKNIPPAPSSINPKIPRYMDDIILKCLEKDPLLRFQNVNILLESLSQKAIVCEKTVEFEMPEINYYSDNPAPVKGEIKEEIVQNISEPIQIKSSINMLKWLSYAVWIAIASGIIYSLYHILILGE